MRFYGLSLRRMKGLPLHSYCFKQSQYVSSWGTIGVPVCCYYLFIHLFGGSELPVSPLDMHSASRNSRYSLYAQPSPPRRASGGRGTPTHVRPFWKKVISRVWRHVSNLNLFARSAGLVCSRFLTAFVHFSAALFLRVSPLP